MAHVTDHRGPPAWKIILAFLLDLITTFFVLGYAIAAMTGDLVDGGFSLSGLPALVLFVLIIAYFVGLGKFGGGTIWQRILGARRG